MGAGSPAGSSFLSNLNRTIRNSYGREFAVNNSISQEMRAIGSGQDSFIGMREETKFRHSDEAGRPSNLTHSNFIGSLESLGFNQQVDKSHAYTNSQIIEEEKETSNNKTIEISMKEYEPPNLTMMLQDRSYEPVSESQGFPL